MNSWVTDGSSSAPIFTPDAFTASFFFACQNWYTQPRLSLAVNTSTGRLASRAVSRLRNSVGNRTCSTGSSARKTPVNIR
ncbi:MAG: hypothetical protein WCQ21_08940, partial [Verrucomicrobiota bacterium]